MLVDPIGENDISQLFDTVSGCHVLDVTLVSLISLLQACPGLALDSLAGKANHDSYLGFSP